MPKAKRVARPKVGKAVSEMERIRENLNLDGLSEEQLDPASLQLAAHAEDDIRGEMQEVMAQIMAGKPPPMITAQNEPKVPRGRSRDRDTEGTSRADVLESICACLAHAESAIETATNLKDFDRLPGLIECVLKGAELYFRLEPSVPR